MLSNSKETDLPPSILYAAFQTREKSKTFSEYKILKLLPSMHHFSREAT